MIDLFMWNIYKLGSVYLVSEWGLMNLKVFGFEVIVMKFIS